MRENLLRLCALDERRRVSRHTGRGVWRHQRAPHGHGVLPCSCERRPFRLRRLHPLRGWETRPLRLRAFIQHLGSHYYPPPRTISRSRLRQDDPRCHHHKRPRRNSRRENRGVCRRRMARHRPRAQYIQRGGQDCPARKPCRAGHDHCLGLLSQDFRDRTRRFDHDMGLRRRRTDDLFLSPHSLGHDKRDVANDLLRIR